MSKKISRRRFATVMGSAAVAATAGAVAVEPAREAGRSKDQPLQMPAAQQPAQEPAASDAKPKYGMSKEQEEQVRQAIERGARGRAALRNYKFKYADEPAFVFQAKSRKQGGKESGKDERR